MAQYFFKYGKTAIKLLHIFKLRDKLQLLLPRNIGSIGVDKCILPSLFTLSSTNHDRLPSLNVRISCTELFADENRKIADSPVLGCLNVTISGVPAPVYCSDSSNASPLKCKISCNSLNYTTEN